MPQNIYTLITAQYAISDNYASHAKDKFKYKKFFKDMLSSKGKDKDNFIKYLKKKN